MVIALFGEPNTLSGVISGISVVRSGIEGACNPNNLQAGLQGETQRQVRTQKQRSTQRVVPDLERERGINTNRNMMGQGREEGGRNTPSRERDSERGREQQAHKI